MMASEYDSTVGYFSEAGTKYDDKSLQLIMNRYASPGGGASTKTQDTIYCVKRPAKGALNGLLLAKKEAYGKTPSRPNS